MKGCYIKIQGDSLNDKFAHILTCKVKDLERILFFLKMHKIGNSIAIQNSFLSGDTDYISKLPRNKTEVYFLPDQNDLFHDMTFYTSCDRHGSFHI